MKIIDKFNNSKNIAIVRTDRLGDMVLTLPLAKALNSYNHSFQITMIASSYTKPLLNNSEIANYFFVDEYQGGINKIFSDNKFDAVFFPMPNFNEVLAAFLSKIPIRIGSAYRFYSFMFNHKVHDRRKISKYHEAEYNVRMLSSITNKEHSVDLVPPKINEEMNAQLVKFLNELKNNQNQKIIAFHPGSRGSARDLSVSTIIEVVNKLSNRSEKIKIILTGSEADLQICSLIAKECPNAVNLCAKFTLDEMISLFRNIDLLLANSTGVLHIAASLGTAVIGFFPNTPHLSAKRWGPYSSNSIVISPPPDSKIEFNDDMNSINPDKIIDSIFDITK